VIAAVVALLGIGWSALSLAPRAAGFAELHPTISGTPFVTIPEFGTEGAYVLGYQHNATVTMTLPVRNEGWLPITVTSVGLNGGNKPLLEIDAVHGLPLSLGPGATGSVTVTALLSNCRFFHERALETYDGLELGFTSFGADGSRHVRFDRPVMVKSPMLASCPDRKLNRQADRRNG
jgi:hypothetical protein